MMCFLVFFVEIASKRKGWPNVFKFQSISILAIRSNK